MEFAVRYSSHSNPNLPVSILEKTENIPDCLGIGVITLAVQHKKNADALLREHFP
jgi:hypothetical protein